MREISQLQEPWRFKSCDVQEWLPAKVPGCVHTDLLRNGRIADPFYGMKEHGLQWIDRKDWEYECEFHVPQDWMTMSHLELVFAGLDTYAEVYVNGKHVLSADNMFRTWKADVKELVRDGANHLRVKFRSPVLEDLPKLEKLGYALPAPNDQSELGGLGENGVSVFARKAPYHYGWDWGPRFVTSGIWREVRLEAWSGIRITDLYIRQQEISEASARLTAVLEVESDVDGDGLLQVAGDGKVRKQEVRLVRGVQTLELADLELAEPKLWWCRGLGAPNLYEFQAQLSYGGRVEAEKTVKTGLRTVRWIKKPDGDGKGTSFYLELNGVPVFAKGANHIPNDSFASEVTYERYRHEIESAARSNMNMLRVWGGGIYEEDIFYELCDEYGILVWQDFMFACSMYPGDEAFLNNVRAEAEENVKRLRNYPSIALWCGNNEMDSAWAHYNEDAGWGWKQKFTPEQRERIWTDYEAVFHRMLPQVVEELAHGMEYWPSSPITGLTGDDGQHATPSSTSGDIHYWGVWHMSEPFENYNVYIGRFMSEYGFQSFPEYKSVRAYAEEADLELESPVMLAHQKNGAGNRLIKTYMDQYMKEPKDFPSFLYMSQVLQAEAMKTAIEAHRRNMPYCMGSLYWQMNDCWPVASWASMDYYGRWKALQYYAMRSFRDVMVSVDGSKDGAVDVYVVSDLREPVEAKLRLRLFGFDGALLKETVQSDTVEGSRSVRVLSLAEKELLEGRDPASVVLLAELEQAGTSLDSKEHYFVSSKELKLAEPVIKVTEAEGSEGTRFILETDVLAKQVWLSSEVEGIFSDNFFDLIPGIPVMVAFEARTGGAAAFAPASPGKLEVRSMAEFVKHSFC